jgi:gluconokinase
MPRLVSGDAPFREPASGTGGGDPSAGRRSRRGCAVARPHEIASRAAHLCRHDSEYLRAIWCPHNGSRIDVLDHQLSDQFARPARSRRRSPYRRCPYREPRADSRKFRRGRAGPAGDRHGRGAAAPGHNAHDCRRGRRLDRGEDPTASRGQHERSQRGHRGSKPSVQASTPPVTLEVTTHRATPVLVLMGVSGSGKSTVGALLAGRLGWDFLEGDAIHPVANVVKMASGHPLNDEDRRPWLGEIASWIRQRTASRQPGIVTCSALKRSYRDALRAPGVVFVYLAGTKEQIARRLAARHGHFMPGALLDSQFADLEPPGPDENAVTFSIGGTPQHLAEEIIARLDLPAGPGTIAVDGRETNSG